MPTNRTRLNIERDLTGRRMMYVGWFGRAVLMVEVVEIGVLSRGCVKNRVWRRAKTQDEWDWCGLYYDGEKYRGRRGAAS